MEQLTDDPKVAVVVAAASTLSGIGHILELIPNDIGKLTSIIGAILSLVLIYTHLRRGRLIRRKLQLEIQAMEKIELDES